jgi:hypothetical protein
MKRMILTLAAVFLVSGCTESKPTAPDTRHPDLQFNGWSRPIPLLLQPGWYQTDGSVTNQGTRDAINVVPQGDFVYYQWEGQTQGTPLPEFAPRQTCGLSFQRADSVTPGVPTFTYQEGSNVL